MGSGAAKICRELRPGNFGICDLGSGNDYSKHFTANTLHLKLRTPHWNARCSRKGLTSWSSSRRLLETVGELNNWRVFYTGLKLLVILILRKTKRHMSFWMTCIAARVFYTGLKLLVILIRRKTKRHMSFWMTCIAARVVTPVWSGEPPFQKNLIVFQGSFFILWGK